MSFTFTDNETSAIAVITGNKRLKYVFLDTEEKLSQPQLEEESSIVDEKLDPDTIEQLNLSFRKGMTLKQVYSLLEGSSSPRLSYFKQYELQPNECIQVLPSATSERVFIAGESGCGKSTIAANYARQYLTLFPENKVYTFLRQEDDAYESIPRQEVVFTQPEDPEEMGEWQEEMENLLSGGITLDQLQDSLVIMDDMDNLQNKKELQAVHKLMNDVATNGRKRNIYCIYVSHLLMNYAQTRVMLNEANKVFFFPGCGTRQIENFLKTYGSMKTKQAEALSQMKSRWVMLSRRVPRYIIHAKGMFML